MTNERIGFSLGLAIGDWDVENYVEKWENGRDLLGEEMWKSGEEGC